MHDWTFVCELCGGTYISQYAGANIDNAVEAWTIDELPNVLKLAANETPRVYNVETAELEEATPLNGLHHVYLWTFNLNYKRL